MQISIPYNKNIIIGAGALLVILIVGILIFLSDGIQNKSRPNQSFNMQAFGTLPPLESLMKNDPRVDALMEKILAYDEAFIFVNYPQVNNDIATLMFYWAGMDSEMLRTLSGGIATDNFLRRVYGMPDDEPIIGNPLLEENPWVDLFNRFKAQILMQGQGYKIYDGLAYYDNELDQMVVRENLSKEFMNGFAEFLGTLPLEERKKYFNNFLVFVRDTKGFNNLSEQDKELIKKLQVQ